MVISCAALYIRYSSIMEQTINNNTHFKENVTRISVVSFLCRSNLIHRNLIKLLFGLFSFGRKFAVSNSSRYFVERNHFTILRSIINSCYYNCSILYFLSNHLRKTDTIKRNDTLSDHIGE